MLVGGSGSVRPLDGDSAAIAREGRRLDVRLCSMPFAPLVPPSLALGLLHAVARKAGARVETCYPSFWFAETVGLEPYEAISSQLLRYGVHEAGQWIFSGALFPGAELRPDEYVERVLRRASPPYRPAPLPERLVETLLGARRAVEAFLERSVRAVLDGSPRLIGFTCSYYQRIPSLALARQIKERSPATFVVLGGPDCEGVMGAEIVRRFAFVDAVVSGPGESAFERILDRVLNGRSVEGTDGVYTRSGADALFRDRLFPGASCEAEMDALPVPDYDDYFRQVEESPLPFRARPWVSLETARGCWWAEREHRCTFCAENLRDVAFRSKSAGRALAELRTITERYRPPLVNMIDRALDTEYFGDVIPALSREPLGTEILFSVRPTLTKPQMLALRNSGVTMLGVGIESLSTPILTLMHKGTTTLQNVQILKWARELGLHVFWNVLWGFPGEPESEYGRMARLVPRLVHLTPPKIETQVVLMRFSPLFEQAEAFGLTDLAPAEAYGYLYPFEGKTVENLAYYFTYQHRTSGEVERYTAPMKAALEAWRQVHSSSPLLVHDEGDTALVVDRRPGAPQRSARLAGLERFLLGACEAQRGEPSLVSVADEAMGTHVSREEVQAALRSLEERWLVIGEGNRWLSLAVLAPVVPAPDVDPDGTGT